MNIKRNTVFLIACLMANLVVFPQSNFELLYLKGDFEQILQKTQKLSTVDDYYWHSVAQNKQGKTLEAIEILENGNRQFEESQKIESLLANYYYTTGKYSKAKPYLLKYTDDPELFMQLINVLEFENNYTLALNLLNQKITHDSLNLQYLTHLGENYYSIDNADLAVKYFEKALSLNSEDQLIANKLANLYFKEKRYVKAIEICNIVLKNDSTNKKFVKIKGMSSFNEGDFKTAETSFNYLLNEGDSSSFILKHLGISEFNNSLFKISKEHLLLAFSLDSNDVETCFFLGRGFLNSQTPETGLYFFNRADSLLQPNPLVLSALYSEKQSVYSTLENYDKALHCYEMAYKYNPKPEYLFYIASLYQNKLNDKKRALEFYEKFLNKLPPKPESDHNINKNQIIISLRKTAESNIVLIKEELFFNGKLKE